MVESSTGGVRLWGGAVLTFENGDSVTCDERGILHYLLPRLDARKSAHGRGLTARLLLPQSARIEGDEPLLEFESWNCLRVIRHGRTVVGRIASQSGSMAGELGGVEVTESWEDECGSFAADDLYSTVTDEMGGFVLPAMPQQSIEVWVDAQQLASRGFALAQAVLFVPAATNQVQFDVTGGVSLSGTLLGAGIETADLSSILIEARSDAASTQVNPTREGGRTVFRCSGTPPGKVDLFVTKRSGALIGMKRGVPAPRNDVSIAIQIPEGEISSSVDLSEVPVDCSVLVKAFSHDALGGVHRNYYNLREFRFTGLRSETTHTLVVESASFRGDEYEFIAMKRGVRVGDSVALNPRSGAYITGRIAGASTYLSSVRATTGIVYFDADSCGSERVFRIGPLAPGMYTVEARDKNFELVGRKEGVRAGEQDVLLTLN